MFSFTRGRPSTTGIPEHDQSTGEGYQKQRHYSTPAAARLYFHDSKLRSGPVRPILHRSSSLTLLGSGEGVEHEMVSLEQYSNSHLPLRTTLTNLIPQTKSGFRST